MVAFLVFFLLIWPVVVKCLMYNIDRTEATEYMQTKGIDQESLVVPSQCCYIVIIPSRSPRH